MSEERLRVLLVDDEASLRLPLKRYLEGNFGYQVAVAADGREAMDLLASNQGQYDVALIDEVLLVDDEVPSDYADGIELMQGLKARYPEVETIIFTGWGRESRQRAIQAGAFRYLEKPFDNDELAMVIRTAAQQVRLRVISREVLSEKDPDKVLESIMVAACSLALADEAAIVLLDRASDRFHVHSRTDHAEPRWQRHFKGQNLSREIMHSGQVVRIPDTEQDERVHPGLRDAGFGAFLGLPIPGEGGNQGVLYVYSRRRNWFEEWGAVAVLQTLAGQAGLALANARAFRDIDTHARYMEALVRAGQGLTQATRLEDQLALAWDFVREQLQTSTFFVALYDRQNRVLSYPLAYDEGERITMPAKQAMEDWGISGYVIRSGGELVWPTDEHKRQQCQALGIEPVLVGKPCQSCIYLPLKVGEEVIGAISIQSYVPHSFPPALLDAFRALGSQLAVALENTRLFAALAEAKQWREALIENAFDAVVAIDQENKITVFNRRAEEMLGWTGEELIGQTVARLHIDISKAQEIRDLVDSEGTIPGDVVELKHRDGDRIPALLSATQIRDSRGRPIGQAGFIRDLRRAHLLEDRLRALIHVSQAITKTLNLDQVLQLVIESALTAFPAAVGGSIHLYDERTGCLHRPANTCGHSQAAEEASHFRPGEGIAGWVFQHNQPVVVDDVAVDPRYKEIPDPEAPAHKSMICVPLRVRQQVIGTLTMHNRKQVRGFQHQDLGLLSTFADQAAIAIDNARRVQEMEAMRRAAEALSRALVPRQALQQIVESAVQILNADSAAVWSYDQVHDRFIPEELAAAGMSQRDWELLREPENQAGRTAEIVLARGYAAVTDISDPDQDFLEDSTRELWQRIGVASFQGVALTLGEAERLGVLCVNYNRARTFAREDEEKLLTFASHATLALKNASSLEKVRKAKKAAEVVARVSVLGEPGQSLRAVAEGTREAVGCDAVALYVYDPATDRLDHPPTMAGVHFPDLASRFSRVEPDSIVYTMLRRNGPTIVERVAEDELFRSTRFAQDEGIESSIAIPLHVAEKKVGVMFVNYRTAHSFAEDELANLELFSNQAAVAIQNAQLYRAELHHAQTLESIQATSSAVSAVLDLQELFPLVTREAARMFSAPASSLMLWDEQKERLVIRAAYGLGERYSQEQCIARAAVEGLVATGGLLPRVFHIAQQPLGRPDLIAEEQLCTALVAPLVKGNDLIGVLCVYSKDEPRQFRDEEVELARVFANHASIAIQNAQLYDDLNKTKELVAARTVLAWLGMASSTWRHSTDKYALTIREQAELLRRDWRRITGHPPSAKVSERLDMIERLATKIEEKLITPPLSSEEGVETISVNALVGERAKQLWQNDPYRLVLLQLDLELPDEALVRVSPEWIRRAFDILVDNAVEAVADRPVREITIGTRPAKEGVEILVSDTGPGIPEEIQAKVGLALIQKPEDARGMGFGLLIAQAIVQVYGGQIRVGFAGPEGTTMVIRLPLVKQA